MKQTTIPEEGIKDARKLGIPRMILLGLQHLFAMFGATVLVPILVASYGLPISIQTTLLFAGVGTLFFHLCTKFKVPAFLGSSFAFLGGFEAVAKLDSGKFATMTGAEKLPYALGGVVVAGLMYLILALLVKAIGVKRVMRFLPPVVTGPIIILIGLILAPSAVTNASGCWWLAALSVVVIIVCNIFGKGMIKIVPILLGLGVTVEEVVVLNRSPSVGLSANVSGSVVVIVVSNGSNVGHAERGGGVNSCVVVGNGAVSSGNLYVSDTNHVAAPVLLLDVNERSVEGYVTGLLVGGESYRLPFRVQDLQRNRRGL